MADLAELVARFDVEDAAFIADPYPTLAALREATPIFWNERSGQWMLTRFDEVHETLRDRRLGRTYTHRYAHVDFGRPDPDPRRFTDPDRFDVGRGDTAHIGFGGGIHFCVGAPLARQEIEVSLRTLVERCPDLEIVAEPHYHPTFVIRGLSALEVS